MKDHRARLQPRGFALEHEHMPATGQAAHWYADVVQSAPRSGREVAKQLARLSGVNSAVRLPWRSLADAVGRRDKAGRSRAYVERGIAALTDGGWLTVKTTGRGRAAVTTFYLLPGERCFPAPIIDDGELDEDASRPSAA